MNKITTLKSRFGHIDVYTNALRNIILAKPAGYIGPGLIKRDLAFLAEWDSNSKTQWKYIVDISNVKVIHPMNPFLLRRIKYFHKMEQYIVYVPSSLIRLLLKSTNWVLKPDLVISDKETLDIVLPNEAWS